MVRSCVVGAAAGSRSYSWFRMHLLPVTWCRRSSSRGCRRRASPWFEQCCCRSGKKVKRDWKDVERNSINILWPAGVMLGCVGLCARLVARTLRPTTGYIYSSGHVQIASQNWKIERANKQGSQSCVVEMKIMSFDWCAFHNCPPDEISIPAQTRQYVIIPNWKFWHLVHFYVLLVWSQTSALQILRFGFVWSVSNNSVECYCPKYKNDIANVAVRLKQIGTNLNLYPKLCVSRMFTTIKCCVSESP